MKSRSWLILAVVWNVILLVLSLIPARSFPEITWTEAFAFDKWVHFGFYLVLFVFIAMTFWSDKGWTRYHKTGWWLVFLYCVLTGWYTEILQSVMYTGRHFEVLDLIANIIGALAGVVFIHLFNKNIISWGLLPSHNSS